MPAASSSHIHAGTNTYWQEATRPLISLVFVAPMLVFYEAGVLILGPQALRNAADVWLRQLLDAMGFSQYFLLPVLTCGLLLGWHYLSRRPWRVRWGVCTGMLVESTLFGVILVTLAGWQSTLASAHVNAAAVANPDGRQFLSLLVGYIGAGIYEEVLFRLLLLTGAAAILRLGGFSVRSSLIAALLITSLLFAAAHYRFEFELGHHRFATLHGEPFVWGSFLFRLFAGLLFSTLFLLRGFGVTAGTHAMYDLFTLLY